MNERAVEILTPLLGADRAREVCALVSLAEACAAIGAQAQEFQRQVAELEAIVAERHETPEEGGETP